MSRLPLLVGALAAALAFGAVTLASDDGAEEPEPGATVAAIPAGQQGGLAVYARMGCGGCHTLAAARSTGEIGPSLDAVLPGHMAASLRAKILNPTPGTAMPGNFGRRMSDAELDALVAFLLAARRAH
jgi:cytochrome c oxidase subunit 2